MTDYPTPTEKELYKKILALNSALGFAIGSLEAIQLSPDEKGYEMAEKALNELNTYYQIPE